MQIAVLYLVTAAVFLVADAVMLRTVIQPIFARALGDQLLDSPRLLPAGLFYLAYVAGVLWLVSWPALRDGAPWAALGNGMLLGAMAYGTYEFTSLAVMRDWTWPQVAVDTAWGSVLTGASAWVGVLAARALA